MKALEAHSYLAVETNITETIEKLDHMKKTLTEYADAIMLQDGQPLLDLEATIAHMDAIKSNLNNIDLSFYEKTEINPTCKLVG